MSAQDGYLRHGIAVPDHNGIGPLDRSGGERRRANGGKLVAVGGEGDGVDVGIVPLQEGRFQQRGIGVEIPQMNAARAVAQQQELTGRREGQAEQQGVIAQQAGRGFQVSAVVEPHTLRAPSAQDGQRVALRRPGEFGLEIALGARQLSHLLGVLDADRFEIERQRAWRNGFEPVFVVLPLGCPAH